MRPILCPADSINNYTEYSDEKEDRQVVKLVSHLILYFTNLVCVMGASVIKQEGQNRKTAVNFIEMFLKAFLHKLSLST